MALGITDLKKGTVFQVDNVPYRVIEYSQKVMGRGGSIVNLRVKSLLDGKVFDKTFKGSEQLERADITIQKVQYLYNDSKVFYFMNQDSFEQFELMAELIGDSAGYMKEGDMVNLQFFNGQPINIDLPKNIALIVAQTDSVVRGDTSTSITKEAQLETGLSVKVPAFIKNGDIISVDTATGTYRERIRG
ncbi:MAG: elongation factor P [Candidatus Saccharimonadales bacterium]